MRAVVDGWGRARAGLVGLALVGCGPDGPAAPSSDGGGATSRATQTSTEAASASDTGAPDSTGEGTASGTAADSTTSAAGSSDSGFPPITECNGGYPWAECDETCVNLATNRGHCGVCDHACEGANQSASCDEFNCTSGLWPCVDAATRATNCAQACASVGEACAKGSACAGQVGLYLNNPLNEPDPEDDLTRCRGLHSVDEVLEDVGCADPIDWDQDYDGASIVGIVCCCTNP